jgi:hypothetical protein
MLHGSDRASEEQQLLSPSAMRREIECIHYRTETPRFFDGSAWKAVVLLSSCTSFQCDAHAIRLLKKNINMLLKYAFNCINHAVSIRYQYLNAEFQHDNILTFSTRMWISTNLSGFFMLRISFCTIVGRSPSAPRSGNDLLSS